MKNRFLFVVLMLAMVMPVGSYAKVGYEYDFQVDGIFYKITLAGDVYVSAEKCVFGNEVLEPEVVINSSYKGVVTIPEKVTYDSVVYDVRGIYIAAFYNCSDIDSIILPNSIDDIGKYAFSGCTNLTEICFPEGLKWIGHHAFSGCTKLKSAELPISLSNLEEGAFKGCLNLQKVIIPKGITYMSGDVFSECTGLKEIILMSSSPVRINNNGSAFYYIFNFNGVSRTDCTIYVPENSIADYRNAEVWNTFQNIEPVPGLYTEGNINYVINSPTDKTVSIVDAKCSGDYVIPASVMIGGEQYIVNRIDDYAFYGNQNLYSVSFPESIVSIGKYAFGGCISIAAITIPKNIEYVDNFSFYNCRDLKKILIEGNTQLYESAFAWCYNIDSIIIESQTPPTLRNNYDPWYITDGPFTDETYENAAICIPEGAFYVYAASDTWSRFSSFYSFLDEGYEADIDNDTIYYTYQDNEVLVGAKVIRRSSFSGRKGLDGPLTPRDPSTVGLQLRVQIRNTPKMTTVNTSIYTPYRGKVVIPESVSVNNRIYPVTGINYLAFVGSKELESITIPESINKIGYASFAGCSGLKDVTVPSGITEIPDAMFYCCSSLGSMIIPEGVQSIGNSAFCGCSGLNEITIPAGVKKIDKYAFAYCTGLKRIVIEGNPVIDETAFIGCGADLELISTVVVFHDAKDLDFVTEGEVHYSIDGRKISAETPGLHIIKHRDGTMVKALIR